MTGTEAFDAQGTCGLNQFNSENSNSKSHNLHSVNSGVSAVMLSLALQMSCP